MKICNFEIEAFLGIPCSYENWYETLPVGLTDEQFSRYCETLKRWQETNDWHDFNRCENGDDYFIHKDLPDIYEIIFKTLKKQAPKIWDDRILEYLDQVNIYTAKEIYEAAK